MKIALIPLFTVIVTILGCKEAEVSSSEQLDVDSTSIHQVKELFSKAELKACFQLAESLRQSNFEDGQETLIEQAKLFQYLSILHFIRDTDRDSSIYYADKAAKILPESAGGSILATQMLCQAMKSFVEWSIRDVQLYAQYGRQILEKHDRQEPLLQGLLLIMEGRGCKQEADRMSNTKKKMAWYVSSDSLFREAWRVLHENNSPWQRLAAENIMILQSRHPEKDISFIDLLTEFGDLEQQDWRELAYSDYVQAYLHFARLRYDSAESYVDRVIADTSQFSKLSSSVAKFFRQRLLEETKKYSKIRDNALLDMYEFGCCPDSIQDPLACQAKSGCLHLLNPISQSYFEEYKETGRPAHADSAFVLSQQALRMYSDALRGATEEAVLTRSQTLSDRIANSAIPPAVALAQTKGDPEYYSAVFRAMEMGKAFLLRKELSEDRKSTRNARELINGMSVPQIEARIKSIKALADINRSLPFEKLEEFWELNRLVRSIRNFTKEASWHGPVLAPNAGVLRIDSLRQSLEANQSFIEYSVLGDSGLALLYVDRDTQFITIIGIDSLSSRIDSLERILTSSTPPTANEYASLTYKLYSQILGPIEEWITHKDQLLIVPSGPLHRLPFAALTSGTDFMSATLSYQELPYLIDQHSIRYLSSWYTDRRYQKFREAEATSVPTVGVWTYGGLANYFSTVTSILTNSDGYFTDLYAGEDCTSSTFLSHAEDYDILQLAVHAHGNREALNQNYLYLAREDSLNGLSIGQLNLSARLVVLAACSTDKGAAYSREGAISVRRSFHVAGVPDVIASLYDIPATSTSSILEIFYAGLLKNRLSPADALAEAQRACRRGEKGAKNLFPGRWAGLIAG